MGWTRLSRLSLLLVGGCFSRPELATNDGGALDCDNLAGASGLRAYFPFEDVTTTTPDLSSFHHDGSIDPTLGRINGRVGQALRWNTKGQKIDLGSPDTLDNLPALTICAWVQPEVHNEAIILVDKTTNGAVGGWDFYLTPEGATYGLGFVNRARVFEETNHVILTNAQWFHVCVTWDGSDGQRVAGRIEGIHLYADAADLSIDRIDESAHALPESDSANPVRIGDVPTQTDYTYRGILDEVMIFDRVLTPDEISDLRDCAP